MRVLARFIVSATLFALVPDAPVAAQGTAGRIVNRGEVRGRVVSAANTEPIGSATMEVRSSGATAPAATTATGPDGSFRFRGLRPGRYVVRARAFGFAPMQLPAIELGAASPGFDVGTLALNPQAVELQSQVVTAQRQAVQLAPDRNAYVVRDMPTTRGGSAIDVLRNVPSVDVDIDNVVSLRGNSGVKIQINGRTNPMKPDQMGNYLAQLPANIVDRVEVVTNPSAREDPDGVVGIINIVLKQQDDAGTSGGLTIGGGTTGRADIGGNVGYQGGPWTLYGSYGFSRDNRPRTDAIYRENLYLNPMTYLEESGRRTQVPLAHTVTASAEYELGKRDALSLETSFSTRVETESYGLLYRNLNAAHALTSLSDRTTWGTGNQGSFESTLGYKHAFAAKGHRLTSELRAVREQEGGPGRVAAHALANDGTPTSTTALENETAWEHPQENSLKVDYVRPLPGRLRFEAGYKGSTMPLHTTLETYVFDAARGAYLPDSSRINNFSYNQVVNAAYGILNAQRGKFVLQGGVRLERATTQFNLKLRGVTYDNSYNSVFPSALVAYNPDDSHQLKLSYSTRIRRPDDTDILDPIPHYADPLNISRGDPYLKPEYIRSLELGLQRSTDRTTVQLTPYFRHSLDAVRSIRTIDGAGVTTRTYANVATTNAYGTDVTLALRGGRLTGFASGSAYRQVSDAGSTLSGLSVKTFGWTVRSNLFLRASRSVDLQALATYQARMNVEQGWNGSRTRFSLAARRKFNSNQTSVTLRVIEPFNTLRERSATIDPAFYQLSDRTRAVRSLLLSVNWLFGKPPKDEGANDLLKGEVSVP